ncbi:putative peptide transporter permease subunit: membrane component of ABC superfamily [[Clostridium] ultunense Esp]|nr:putative peptide transporter permease subunit: membrane component of ABC superfamily [[Clostridium] ultunense Esp]
MYKYILRRLLMMIPVLLGVLFIVFVIIEITPGDPAAIMLGESARQEDIENLREKLGLNDPFAIRFVNYVKGVVTKFDLGISYNTKRPVSTEILQRFPKTALLAALSALISAVLGITLGIISATKQYTIFDNLATGLALLGVSIPNFWQGLMNIIIFSIWLGWLPASGSYGPKYWILPALTLGTSATATIMRMTRSSMLEVIRQDYIRTARAKGQSEKVVILKHALKNALIPVITVIGIQFGGLLEGSVLVESVFAIPGLGKYMIDAIKQRDFPVVQGGVLFLAFAFSFVNLIVDIIYSFIDPRIKSQYKTDKKDKDSENKNEKEVAYE